MSETLMATGSYQAYPPGTELWYADIATVRRVRVCTVEVIVRGADLRPEMVRHRLVPVDGCGDLDSPAALKSHLGEDREAMEAKVARQRAEAAGRAAAPPSDRVGVDLDALKATYGLAGGGQGPGGATHADSVIQQGPGGKAVVLTNGRVTGAQG